MNTPFSFSDYSGLLQSTFIFYVDFLFLESRTQFWHQASSAKMMCVTYGKSRAAFRYAKEKRV